MLRTRPQCNKELPLPVGVFRTWRRRPWKRPYLEFSVPWIDAQGVHHRAHFYVGVDPTPDRERQALQEARAFREAYEARTMGIRPEAPARKAPRCHRRRGHPLRSGWIG